MKIELWDEVATLQRQMDELFGGFFAPRTRMFEPPVVGVLRRPFAPVTDVYEKDGKRIIHVEIPGIDPQKDLSVTLKDGYLVIEGERVRHEEIKEEDVYRVESFYGDFRRYFRVPEGLVDTDITADYVDGILEDHDARGRLEAIGGEDDPDPGTHGQDPQGEGRMIEGDQANR